MRVQYERSILATYLYRNLLPVDEFKSICERELEEELFISNRSHRLIARAIKRLMDEDLPVDEFTVIDFIKNYEPINEQEFLNVMSSTPIPYKEVEKYVKLIRQINKIEEIRGLRA